MVAEFRLDLPNQVSGVVNIQKKEKKRKEKSIDISKFYTR
jgi:hypothetical protein